MVVDEIGKQVINDKGECLFYLRQTNCTNGEVDYLNPQRDKTPPQLMHDAIFYSAKQIVLDRIF